MDTAKLDMDLSAQPRLRVVMVDEEDPQSPQALLPRVFALITAKLEDMSAEAAGGQARDCEAAAIRVLANRVHIVGAELQLLADVVLALTASNERSA